MIDTILYFGSFNPIHNGHVAIAEYLLGHGFCEELWLVISPHNPLKEQSGLEDEHMRLDMARIAVSESAFSGRIVVCDIEFSLSKPSYTIDTLLALETQYGDRNFSILIGSDNVDSLDQWKDYQILTSKYKFWVYPRQGAQATKFAESITLLDNAPRWDFSSTEIRHALQCGDACDKMLSGAVLNYIKEKKLWTKEKVYRAK